MTFSNDTATDIGALRNLLSDIEEADAVFQDEQLAVFLDKGGSIDRAWARALTAAAMDVGVRQRLARKLGIEADGAGVMSQLMKMADFILRNFDTSDDAEAGGLFDWAEQVPDDFSRRERLTDDVLRGLA